MAASSKSVKKYNDPKHFDFANLSKLIDFLKTNESLISRKNPGEIQAFVKNYKLESSELTKMNNERILPKSLKKNNSKHMLSLKHEAGMSKTNIKQITIVSSAREKEKVFPQIPLFEDCFPKLVAKNADPLLLRRENRSVSINSSRAQNANFQEKSNIKSPSGDGRHEQLNNPVLGPSKSSPKQSSQFHHIAKFFSSFEEDSSKDENLIGSTSFSKSKKKNIEISIPDMSKAQTIVYSSKYYPQTSENQTDNKSSSPKMFKSEVNSSETSFVWKEKARFRKIVDVQVQKPTPIISPLDTPGMIEDKKISINRRKSSTDPEKESERSLSKTTRRLEKVIAENRSSQDVQRENLAAGQENEREDNIVGLKTSNQLRERNYYFAVRLENYLVFLNKINFSNMLFVMQLPRVKPQQTYRYHVKKGNNHLIIKKAFKKRWWWQPVDIIEGKSYDNLNFLWSPWRINEFINVLRKHDFDQLPISCKDESLLETSASSLNDSNDRDKFEDSYLKLSKNKTLDERQVKEQFANTDTKLLASLRRIFSNVDFKNQGVYEQISGALPERNDRKGQVFMEPKKGLGNYSKYQFHKLTETLSNKMYNHLEHNFLLSNKKALFLNLRQYYLSQKMDPFEFIPLTFHIREGVADQEFSRFREYYNNRMQESAEKNIWILKPGENTNRGVGITICENIEEIEKILVEDTVQINGKPKTFIVQKYIEKPLLYQRRKFDIRCYILMTSINGIQKGYWYQDGYVRTSSTEFTLENLRNKQIHLTNDAVQKKCDDYGKHESGNKICFSDLQKHFDAAMLDKKINFMGNIYPQLKKLALDAIVSVFGRIDPYRRDFSFELFGLDFMIDDDLKPYLIEINTNPCLELSSPLLTKLIPTMIENLFRMVIDPIFPPPFEWPISRRDWIPENCLENNKFELIFDERGADIPKFGLNTANQLLGISSLNPTFLPMKISLLGQIIDECEEDIDTELME